MIPQAFIQDLLARVDIVDVVGRHVKLRKAGANLLGLCPFHGEKTPSFTVSPSKQFYHCFGCQAHGSAIGFLMDFVGMGYVEAIEELARAQGLAVPREPGARGPLADGGAPVGARSEESKALMGLHERAAAFYRAQLKDTPRAVAYLKGRGLSGRTAARYGLGYAPAGWRNLAAIAPDYDDARWVRAGLVTEREGDETRRYDRFRDRVMFPIRDARGQTIAFGARILERGEPKYLNSPETPIFVKGRELYGLFEARAALRRENRAVVVEGYMDVVMLAEHGVENAVATLGTAVTPDQVKKLLRTVDAVCFAFDGDVAGRKAAWRALQACLPVIGDTQRATFLFLPDGEDPDSFVRARGAPAFRQVSDEAMPLSSFLVDELQRRHGLDTPEARAAFLAEVAPLLALLAAPGLRVQLSHRICGLAGLSTGELDAYLKATAPAAPGAAERAGAGHAGPGRPVYGAQSAQARSDASGERHPDWPEDRASAREPSVSMARASLRAGAGERGPRRFDRGGFGAAPAAAVRAPRPSLARRLRLLLLCHPVLCDRVLTGAASASASAETAGASMVEPGPPEELVRWARALRGVASTATVDERLAALAAAGLKGGAEVAQDHASGWGGVPSLNEAEAQEEFVASMEQLRRRAARAAAVALVQDGLEDEAGRRRHRELLASHRRS